MLIFFQLIPAMLHQSSLRSRLKLALSLVTTIPVWVSAQTPYGYGPTDPGFVAPAPVPVESSGSGGGIGLGHVRGGTFFQLEGTTFSLSEMEGEVGQAVSFMDADTTYGLMGTVGGIGRHGLGFELSAGYYKSEYSGSVKDFAGLDAEVNAELIVVPVFANVRFQLGLTESLALEVAAGAGGAYATASGSAETNLGDFSTSADGLAGGWQGMVGLSYALGSHADITLAYRYMVFSTADDLNAQSLGIGIRLRL